MAWREHISPDLPPGLARRVPSGYELVGDIAIISLPDELRDYDTLIASAILSRHRNVRTVLHRSPIPRGDTRVPGLRVIAGEGTETTCREFGFSYRLDLSRVFYSSRLASERQRIAGLIRPGEEVLVPFAGVGPFVVPVAARGARVTAIENNPASVWYLRENLRINRVAERVSVVFGDFFEVARSLAPGYDRAIVPAPYRKDDALPVVSGLVREGGIIHMYTFGRSAAGHELSGKFGGAGFGVMGIRRCGNVAPGICRYALDLVKTSDPG
jgi:tRNA (guanine37-N1)-methyltransferase